MDNKGPVAKYFTGNMGQYTPNISWHQVTTKKIYLVDFRLTNS